MAFRQFGVRIGMAATVLASAALADEAAEKACHDQPNTGAVNICLAKVHADLDRDLNAAYKRALTFIEDAGLQPNLTKDWKRALQEAQRKWIAYREADCGAPVSYEWAGGSATGSMQIGCKIARTRERLVALRRRYGRD